MCIHMDFSSFARDISTNGPFFDFTLLPFTGTVCYTESGCNGFVDKLLVLTLWFVDPFSFTKICMCVYIYIFFFLKKIHFKLLYNNNNKKKGSFLLFFTHLRRY